MYLLLAACGSIRLPSAVAELELQTQDRLATGVRDQRLSLIVIATDGVSAFKKLNA